MIKVLFGLIVAVLLNLSVNAQTTKLEAADLTSKKWVLRGIGDSEVSLGNDLPFINFDAKKSSSGGNTGCNVFGGTYAADGSKIKFTNIISTMRACEAEGRMTIERGFLDGLQNADRFEIKAERLFLYSGNNVLLEFEGIHK